jgi:hypothetical protein
MKHRQPTTIIRTLATLSLFALFTGSSGAALTVVTDYDFSGGTPSGGTLVGNANISGGKLNLDGAGDYLLFSTTALTALNNYVVEAIFNATSYPSFAFMVYNGSTTSPNINKAGQAILKEGTSLDGILPGRGLQGTSAAATVGTNIALALVRNNGTSTVYVNGTAYTPTNSGTAPTVAATMLAIGAGFSNAGAAEGFFNGTIDRVRLSTFSPGTFSSADLLGPTDGTIPEPNSLVLLSVASLMTFRRRRC